ncbi:small ribosomal subunit protein uS7m [Eleutherodactylus coqui]|uniref:small ribosomal subunit protein uS7m n=1 Tax=Eleutherodactylus coqui TaxID=57060 RepID=UPI003462709D
MAAPRCQLLVQRIKAGLPGLIQVRWSRYDTHYLDPVAGKEKYSRPMEELSQEEKEEWDFKLVRPIKACPSALSSSVFTDPTVSKFTNLMMKGGDKILSRYIMNKTLEKIKRIQLEKYHKASPEERETIVCNPYVIFNEALEKCSPIIGLASILKSGKYYQVPVPLTEKKRQFLAMKWIITEGREKKARRTFMYDRLADILLEAFRGEGSIIKKKNDLHKMAESNRAFAHFRWW